jgi:hypothetical protein
MEAAVTSVVRSSDKRCPTDRPFLKLDSKRCAVAHNVLLWCYKILLFPDPEPSSVLIYLYYYTRGSACDDQKLSDTR